LIDGRRSTSEQLGELIRELIEVEAVDLWVVYNLDAPTAIGPVSVERGSAHEVYLLGEDSEDAIHSSTRRVLRIGTTPIGAMVLRGWRSDPPLADAVASLVAVAFERTRALQKENRAEAQRNTEQLRAAVLDGLAHGFKTPLTAIQTASSGLLEINQMTATQTELVSIIDEQATVLGQLTTRLLQTAALEAKEVRLRRTMESIVALLEAVLEEEDQETRARVTISAAPDLQRISVDAQLIKLALLQLIDNAAKYATVGPLIEVKVTESDLETTITVINQGPRIKPEERERIFERFYRSLDIIHGPTGTGLGLSIVKKTAEAHGGRVWVESDSDSTRFSLAIPR
jgi:two-component system sensor histidine kinase KdpD